MTWTLGGGATAFAAEGKRKEEIVMTRASTPRQPAPQDVCVIYPGGRRGEPRYVAHSLRTDQVAVGDCVLDAYVELLLALRALYQEAREDPSIQTECAAPNEVWQMLRTAKKLPAEIEDDLFPAKDAKNQGKMRLEGKDYIVEDGDILLIRFKV